MSGFRDFVFCNSDICHSKTLFDYDDAMIKNILHISILIYDIILHTIT